MRLPHISGPSSKQYVVVHPSRDLSRYFFLVFLRFFFMRFRSLCLFILARRFLSVLLIVQIADCIASFKTVTALVVHGILVVWIKARSAALKLPADTNGCCRCSSMDLVVAKIAPLDATLLIANIVGKGVKSSEALTKCCRRGRQLRSKERSRRNGGGLRRHRDLVGIMSTRRLDDCEKKLPDTERTTTGVSEEP